MGLIVKKALCLDLASAGLIIGFLGTLSGLWNVIKVLKEIIYFDDDYYKDMKDESESEAEAESSLEFAKLFKPFIFAIVCVGFVICLLDLISSLLLLRGTMKKSHTLLLPWLIIKGIALAITTPFIMLFFLFGIYWIASSGQIEILLDSVLALLGVCVAGYLFVIIYSLYHSIRDENLKPPQIDAEALYTNSTIQYNKT